MPRTFADDLASDGQDVFLQLGEFGEAWIHVTPSGEQEPFVGVFVEYQPTDPQSDPAGDRSTRTGQLHCPRDLVVQLAPQAKSRFVRGDQVWFPTGVSDDGSTQVVQLTQSAVHTYRGGPRQRAV